MLTPLQKQRGKWCVFKATGFDPQINTWRINWCVRNVATGKVMAVTWNRELARKIAARGAK